jgi:hypothetical protein
MSRSMDVLLEDVALEEEMLEVYEADQNIALSRPVAKRIRGDNKQLSDFASRDLSLVSLSEITSAIRAIGKGLFGKR